MAVDLIPTPALAPCLPSALPSVLLPPPPLPPTQRLPPSPWTLCHCPGAWWRRAGLASALPSLHQRCCAPPSRWHKIGLGCPLCEDDSILFCFSASYFIDFEGQHKATLSPLPRDTSEFCLSIKCYLSSHNCAIISLSSLKGLHAGENLLS